MSDQIEYAGFEASEFAENPEPRVPCVLLLDVSGSMSGKPIAELNEGLITLKDTLSADSLASKRAEMAIVTFGGKVDVVRDFTTAEHFQPPHLSVSGDTPMGQAITTGLGMIWTRKNTYRTNGISYYRPWVFLITDGGPTDAWASAAEQVKAGEASKSFAFFSVGVEGANFETLGENLHACTLKAQGAELPRPLPLALAVDAIGLPVFTGRQGEPSARRMGRNLIRSRHVEAGFRQRPGHVSRSLGAALPGLLPRAHVAEASWSPPALTVPGALSIRIMARGRRPSDSWSWRPPGRPRRRRTLGTIESWVDAAREHVLERAKSTRIDAQPARLHAPRRSGRRRMGGVRPDRRRGDRVRW